MTYSLKYRSDTVVPPCIVDILEIRKTSLLALSKEPDKAVVLFDAMRSDLISWFAYHAEISDKS